jgi:HK97 family phage portal protein
MGFFNFGKAKTTQVPKAVKPSATFASANDGAIARGNYLLAQQYEDRRQESKVYWDVYENSPWAGTCIDLISNAGSKKWHLVPVDKNVKTIDPDTVAPILEFLNAPNDIDTFSSLVSKIYRDLIVFGSCIMEFRTTSVDKEAVRGVISKAFNAFTGVIPNIDQEIEEAVGEVAQDGLPTWLKVLPFQQMEVLTDEKGRITGYRQWTVDGGRISYGVGEVIHIFHPKSQSGTYGDSRLKSLIEILTTDALIDRRQKRMLQNDVVLDKLFSIPNATNEEEVKRFYEQMMTQYRQAGSNGNFLVTTEEVKVDDISRSKDGDFLKQGEDNRNTIAMRLGVPLSVLGDTSGTSSTYAAGSDNALRSFLENTVRPLSNHIEHHLNRSLMAHFGNVGLEYLIAFDLEDADDSAAVETMYDQMIRNGTKTINEIRALRGDDPIQDGDTAWIDAKGAMTLDMLLNPPEPVAPPVPKAPEPPPQDDTTEKAVVELRRALRTLRKSL